jgi:BirA family transcriptional regulator, biotin operon repressor / biotin---[acetyl-CoA-carboxylase] ligase
LYNIQPKTVFVGKTIKYLPTCQSTNDWLQQLLIHEVVPNGFCVITDHQTNGRGQRGNTWQAEPGKNITLSLYIHPAFLKASDQFYLNIAISLGVYDSLIAMVGSNLKVKWPNDIYYGETKIGGILIENAIQGAYLSSSIIGIGINVNQEKFENKHASSIKNILASNHDLELGGLIKNILENIDNQLNNLKTQHFDWLKAKYFDTLFRFNQWHSFKKNELVFTGKIISIEPSGRLVLETEIGLNVFDFKEIEFVI